MPPKMLSGRRLLFLLPFAPRLDALHGGGRAMAQLLVRLAERHEIALLYLRAADEPPIDDILRERCVLTEEIMRPRLGCSQTQRWIRRARLLASFLAGRPILVSDWAVAAYRSRTSTLARTWQPDIVQIEYHLMGQYLSALSTCSAPRVLIEHEPGVQAARDLQRVQRGFARLIAHLDTLAWERFEPKIIRKMQAIVVFTERDQQAVAPFAGHTPVMRIPLGTSLPEHPLSPLGCPPVSLAFVGNFTHAPNIDAATRLISTILPSVRVLYPDVRLYIVGDQPPAEIRQMESENVIVTGRVPDVTPYLDRAALVVIPLRLGGGMRVKVLEALAAGKAVIASPLAVEGLDLVDGKQVILAESDQQFSDTIAELLADPNRRISLANRAREWACANLGWEKSVAAYESLYQRLVEGAL